MSQSVIRLRDTITGLASKALAPEHVSRIAQLSRHIIEEQNTQQQFPVLNLYCNWLLHPQIDKSATADQILAEIDDILFVRKKVATFTSQAVQPAVGLQVLRCELASLLKAHGLPDDLVVNNGRWKEFARLVLRDLCAKTLTFKQAVMGKSNKVLDRVLKDTSRIGEFYVSSATFTDNATDLAQYPSPPDFLLKLGGTKINDSNFVINVMIPITV